MNIINSTNTKFRQFFPKFILPLATNRHCQVAPDHNEFHLVYKLPLIRHFRFIARLKTYQAAFMVLSLPPLSYMYKMDAITSTSFIQACCGAGGTVTVLSVLSYGFTRFIGEIRYNEQSNTLRVSHLNFFGNKKTHSVNVEDIVPFDDLNESRESSRNKALLKFSFREQLFYFSFRFGLVIDYEMLKKIWYIMY